MSELSIILSVIVLILIVSIYNKQNSKCDEYITYFDKIYYDLPTVDAVASSQSVQEGLSTNLNEISNTPGSRGIMSGEFNANIIKNKFGPLMDHPCVDVSGRIQYDCLDQQNLPPTILNRLNSEIGNNPLPSSVTQRGAVVVEGFADDAWLDESFKFNSKYATS
jgi:hypothetical protein